MKAVIFDLFGTLIEIAKPLHPYRRLLGSARPAEARRIAMTRNLEPKELAEELGLLPGAATLNEVVRDIDEELASARAFADTETAIATLRFRGLRIGVCSNLAKPYGRAAALVEGVDAWVFSYNIGLLKPDARIFQAAAEALGVAPNDCVVVGDTPTSDIKGAASAGMSGILVDRKNRFPHLPSAQSLTDAVGQILRV